MTIIKAKLSNGKEVSIVNIEGMRCTVVNSKGVLSNVRFEDVKIIDTGILPSKK